MDTLKLIIVDDHALYRLGVKAVLTEKIPQAEILAECSSGKELLVYLENNTIPELIILDIVMPEMNGVQVAKVLRKEYPKVKIIMLSSEMSPDIINEILDIGVDGYLSKLAVKVDLISAIEAVLSGNLFYGKDIAKVMYDIHVSKNQKQKKYALFQKKKSAYLLSEREKEIVELLCEGFSVKEIANQLNVSPRTIDNHKARVMQKLGFHNTIELVKYAIREKIVLL